MIGLFKSHAFVFSSSVQHHSQVPFLEAQVALKRLTVCCMKVPELLKQPTIKIRQDVHCEAMLRHTSFPNCVGDCTQAMQKFDLQ